MHSQSRGQKCDVGGGHRERLAENYCVPTARNVRRRLNSKSLTAACVAVDTLPALAHGGLLISYANRAVNLNEEMLVRLRALGVSGRVTLGMSADVALVGLAPALKRFQSLHPNPELP